MKIATIILSVLTCATASICAEEVLDGRPVFSFFEMTGDDLLTSYLEGEDPILAIPAGKVTVQVTNPSTLYVRGFMPDARIIAQIQEKGGLFIPLDGRQCIGESFDVGAFPEVSRDGVNWISLVEFIEGSSGSIDVVAEGKLPVVQIVAEMAG